jgi:hypothetical protein
VGVLLLAQTSVRCVVVYPSDQIVEEQRSMSCATSGSEFGVLSGCVSV